MYQSAYSDSLHQRLDSSMYSANTDYASSSTTRSSFSQPPPSGHQSDGASIMSSNPWGAPDMFATDPKLAAFYGDASALGGMGMGLTQGAMGDAYEYDQTSGFLGDLGLEDGMAAGLTQFSPEDIEAIIASGILDNNTAAASATRGGSLSTLLAVQHPRLSQQQLHHNMLYPTPEISYPGQERYDSSYVYAQLQQQEHDRMRVPSMASVMGLAPSPPYFPASSSPSPQDHTVVRGDSAIIVHSPPGLAVPESDMEISVSSPQAGPESVGVSAPAIKAAATPRYPQDVEMGASSSQAVAKKSTPAATSASTNRYSLIDFVFHHTLGTGSFGRVHLVQSKHNRRFYAIKVLAKDKVVRLKQVEHTNSERALLGLCKHPFLVNLWGTFQDQLNLFMVMDFVAGGELFTLIRKSVRFPPTVAKFYAAEVATALEYLHQIDIIYRDLKPENILIGQDGHVKLTDFGFAKRVKSTEQTYTMCGTPDYLAPEIILSQGYTQSVDWYAWGVLIFEMLAGHPPFYTKNSDPAQLYRKIIEGHVRYPAQIDAYAKDLIGNCLSADLSKRFGNTRRGSIEIFRHPWFAEVNWEMLVRKEIPAPYLPALNGEGDSSQFEAYAENDPKSEYGKTGPDPFEDFFADFS